MGELTNKVGRDDKARLAYLKQAGWGKPMNMMNSEHKSNSKIYKKNFLNTFTLKCKKHPLYKGIHKPKGDCKQCWRIWRSTF